MRTAPAWRLIAVLLAAVLSPATQAADAPPLRTVQRGFAKPDAIRTALQDLVDTCREGRQLPAAPATMPSPAVMARTPQIEVETLFDGERWAEYTTTAQFVPDPKSCETTVWRTFSAKVRDGCATEVQGSSGAGLGLVEPPPKPWVRESAARCASGQPRPAPVLTGLPTQDAGHGERCVWTSDITARATGGGRAAGFDTCVSVRRPSVLTAAGRREVVLRTRLDPKTADGASLLHPMPLVEELQLAEYSEGGGALPAERFSRRGVEAFVAQAARLPIGGRP